MRGEVGDTFAGVSEPELMAVNCPDFLYACWYSAGCWGGAVFAKVAAMSEGRHRQRESDAAADERRVLREKRRVRR